MDADGIDEVDQGLHFVLRLFHARGQSGDGPNFPAGTTLAFALEVYFGTRDGEGRPGGEEVGSWAWAAEDVEHNDVDVWG